MPKYALLRQRVVEANLVPSGDLQVGPAASDQELTRAHTPEYVRKLKEGDMGACSLEAFIERVVREVGERT